MPFAAAPTFWENFTQFTVLGLTYGFLFALIALGYTMVYGIVELINFAHGDLFMLCAFLALTILNWFGVAQGSDTSGWTTPLLLYVLFGVFVASVVGGAALNFAVDRVVYKPLRNAPKLAPLVSAIGVSFIFMNAGLFWGGPQPVAFPDLVPNTNLLDAVATEQTVDVPADEAKGTPAGTEQRRTVGPFDTRNVRVTWKDVMVVGVTVPLMVALTLFVQFSRLGKAMRAVAQNPTAARLMGINVDSVIGATFLIGGGLGGAASVVYSLHVNTVNFQMGFQNGLYAFTAAVLGGIGRLPGAVLGGLIIGLVRAYGSAYVGEEWVGALVFGILILILVFRPTGLLGSPVREKV